jgi:SAM-dependent methyltransferase
LDINEGMRAVARTKSDFIEWRYGQAGNLPFSDNRFDRVISQFGLMFFDNRQAAIQEMMRVLKPGGRLAIAVRDTLDNTPGYAAVTQLLKRLFGVSVADAMRAPFCLGKIEDLDTLFTAANLNVEIQTHPGTAKFPSLESWMYTDIKGWTLASIIDDAQFELLLNEAKISLK